MRIIQSGSARLTAFGLVLCVFACQDSTAPARRAGERSDVSALVVPVGAVRVFPDSMRGWMFFDDQHGAACLEADNCHIARDTSQAQFGATSVALATPSAGDADVLMLPAFRGTRLDRVTELRYSTFRESSDIAGRLAVMLQLNVDYDLTDSYAAYEGRIVFEPAQARDGAVPQNTWQRWDTRAGSWWGTKTVVRRGGVETQNVCTPAAPCTWAKLVTAYPNIGIHATNGAVVLQAGAKWAGFRGNVDSLTIAVNGVATTYDFDTRAVVEPPAHLYARIGAGVLSGTRMPDDTTYARGTLVAYNFTPAPGHDGPYVVVDDTVAATTGVVVMDGTHSIEVASDTIYTLDGLSDDGKEIAARLRRLLTTGDKVETYADLMTFFNTRVDAGADATVLAGDFAVASRLVIDQVRDSTALRVVDEALTGYVFTSTVSTPYVEFSRVGQVRPRASGAGLSIKRPPGMVGAPNGPMRDLVYADQLESPKEPTVIVYMNGINTQRYEAALTTTRLRQLVFTQRRFSNGFTTVDHIYNPTHSVDMEVYDQAHPCAANAWRDLGSRNPFIVLYNYSRCADQRAMKSIAAIDLVAAFRERLQLHFGETATAAEVRLITTYVDSQRTTAADPKHVIFVGHSEATILLPQALRELPAIEGHPLNNARACLATLSLAGAANRSAYALDEPFKLGFIVEGDIIDLVTVNNGWKPLPTDATEQARARVTSASWNGRTPSYGAFVQLRESYALHSVDRVYLGDPAARSEVVYDLTELHQECTQGDLTVSPTAVTAEAGTSFKVTPKLINQNGNELFGRYLRSGGGVLDSIAPNTYLVTGLAAQPAQLDFWTGVLYTKVMVSIPPVSLVGTSIVESYYSSWEFYSASNAGLGDAPYGFEGQIPTNDNWDGSDGTCTKYYTAYGRTGPAGPSYMVWVRSCKRIYTVIPGPPANAYMAAKVIGHDFTWYYANGGVGTPGNQVSVTCAGPERCIIGVKVVAYASLTEAGSSGFVAAASGASGVSPGRVSAAARPRRGARTNPVPTRARALAPPGRPRPAP